MKMCEKCGAVQGDERTVCVDCGAILKDKLTPKMESAVDDMIKDDVSRMNDKIDPVFVSTADKIFGVLSIIFALILIAAIIYTVRVVKNISESDSTHHAVITYSRGETDVITDDGFNSDEVKKAAFCGIICFVCSAAWLLIPKLIWSLFHFRISMFADGDISPSKEYKNFRKFISAAMFLLGCIMLADVIIKLI